MKINTGNGARVWGRGETEKGRQPTKGMLSGELKLQSTELDLSLEDGEGSLSQSSPLKGEEVGAFIRQGHLVRAVPTG